MKNIHTKMKQNIEHRTIAQLTLKLLWDSYNPPQNYIALNFDFEFGDV